MSQCHISWDSYKKNISDGFSHLQQREEFVDMTLAAEGHLVKVHRNLIALASPYLKDMLRSAPCTHPVVFLNNISHEVLAYILEYVYTGEVEVPMDRMTTFIDTAKALHIKGLDSVIAPTVPRVWRERSHHRMNIKRVNAENPEIRVEKQSPAVAQPLPIKIATSMFRPLKVLQNVREPFESNNNENVTNITRNKTFIHNTEEVPIKTGANDVKMDNSRIYRSVGNYLNSDNFLEANNPSLSSMMKTQTCNRNEDDENKGIAETVIDNTREEPIELDLSDILRDENNTQNNEMQLDANMEQLQGHLYFNIPVSDDNALPIINKEPCNLNKMNTHHNVINSCDLNLPQSSQSYNFTIRNSTDGNTIPRIDIINAAMGQVFPGATTEVDNLNDNNLPINIDVDISNNDSLFNPEMHALITPSYTIKVPDLSSSAVDSETIPSCAPNIGAMDLSGTSPLYSLSKRGSIQLIFNRYIYNCHHSSRLEQKQRWRCIDYRRKKCEAVVDTQEDIIVKRYFQHSHPFHNNKIIQKGRKNTIYTTIAEVKEASLLRKIRE